MRWYTQMGRRVWPHEILGFLRDRRLKHGPTVEQFWGAPQDSEEESMSSARPERRVGTRDEGGYPTAASATSFATVLMLRAVPLAAAGIFSFERPMPAP
jgi:hypothetical protein